jgi:hypothetical protein
MALTPVSASRQGVNCNCQNKAFDYSGERCFLKGAFFHPYQGDIMNNLIKIISAILVLFACASRVTAEEWSYTGYYPYVYTPSSDTWYYLPDSPPLAWDYSAGEWVTNPLGGNSFDVREIFDKYPLQLDMTIDDYPDVTMQILFNFSGVDTSIVSYTVDGLPSSGEVYTCNSVDAQSGTCLMQGSFDSGETFSLQLDFSTATSGTYKMIGRYPFFAYTQDLRNQLGVISGPFTLKEYSGE